MCELVCVDFWVASSESKYELAKKSEIKLCPLPNSKQRLQFHAGCNDKLDEESDASESRAGDLWLGSNCCNPLANNVRYQ